MDNFQFKNILIATAKRRDSSDNVSLLSDTHKESKNWDLIEQHGRYDKHVKLPMNMILSQTARRENHSQTLENSSSNSILTYEDVISSYGFSNEKNKRWENKKKKNFNAPTVIDVIQNKYQQLYRNDNVGIVCLRKNAASDELIKQEDPLEASEFPLCVNSKKSRLRVKWEDESPLSFIKPSTDSIRHEGQSENILSLIDGSNRREQNEIASTHCDFRFSELYNDDNFMVSDNPTERKITGGITHGALKTETESNAHDDVEKYSLLQKNDYFSENCFLKSVTELFPPNSKHPWEESNNDETNMNDFVVPESESNLPLTCDLFNLEDDHKIPLTCDLFEVPNSQEAYGLDEQNNFDSLIYESSAKEKEVKNSSSSPLNEDSLFDFEKISPNEMDDMTIHSLSIPDLSQNVSPKKMKPKVYLSDPDDLLKTP